MLFSPKDQTEEHIKGCLARETAWTIILYSEHSRVSRCSDNRMTQKYQGFKSAHLVSSYSTVHDSEKITDLTITMFSPSFVPGSYIQAAEKSFSMVRGGRTREAAALAWERQGPAPDRTSYKNWAKSVLENPAVVESKVKSSTVNEFRAAEGLKTSQKSKF